MAWIRGRNWYFWWLLQHGAGGGPTPDPPVVIFGPAINVQTAGVQIPFATLAAPVPGQHFVLRRAGVIKSMGYTWTVAPQISLGTVAPWTDAMPNRNLTLNFGTGAVEAEPNIFAYPSGTTFYVDVNSLGSNTALTAHVYPYLIGFWKTLSIC